VEMFLQNVYASLTNNWEDYGLDIYVCVSQVCTIPLDTAKVRLQLQGKALAGEVNVVPKYRGMVGTIATIAREEGTISLWRGIVPGLHRQILFGGLRIGLYEPVCFSHLAFLPHHSPFCLLSSQQMIFLGIATGIRSFAILKEEFEALVEESGFMNFLSS
jgi:hypothetical protein